MGKFQMFFLLVMCAAMYSCETRSAKAVKYNDSIIEYQAKISRNFSALDSALNTYDAREMKYAIKILDANIITGQRLLDTLGAFKKDSTLLKASINLFNFYDHISEDYYPELIGILKLPDSLYTSTQKDRAHELDSIIRSEFSESHQRFVETQSVFWEKYHIVPREDEE